MDSQHIEDLIKEALEAKQVEFEISKQRGALVLSVPNDSELVGLLDQAFNLSMASLIPLDRRGNVEPTFLFRIDRYTVSPTLREKRTANGRYFMTSSTHSSRSSLKMALNLGPFGSWTLLDKAAQRRLALP